MENKNIFKDEWLVKLVKKMNGITSEILDNYRKQHIIWLSDSLINDMLLTEDSLCKEIHKEFNINSIELTKSNIDKLSFTLVPEKICRNHCLIPIRVSDKYIDVAMACPLDIIAKSDVEIASGRTLVAYYCLPSKIESLIENSFNPDAVVYELLKRVDDGTIVEVLEEIHFDEAALAHEVRSPVIKLVNSLITFAVHKNASDIHIEHEEHSSLVRFRIDGIMKNIMSLPLYLGTGPVVSRLKIMANLDLAKHFIPQDGRAKLSVGGTPIGLRVSILPTSFGEKVVMRLLDPNNAKVPFEKLGFKPEISNILKNTLKTEQGMVLVTGPTGSGKTTSLYSMLNLLKTEQTNITTIEDPIEYHLEGINQVQVNEKQGLTFPVVLRSVLRQDPDIILVGEIRDKETADIAFQSAMTGHLVFSTLHTNDALSSISRLLDMGVERFKAANGILAITAQRLVRRLCAQCKERVPEDKIDTTLKQLLNQNNLPFICYKPGGCVECDYTGYKGRFSILEILVVDQEIKDLINSDVKEEDIRKKALNRQNLWPLISDALWHLTQGDTSLDEILPYIQLKEQEISTSHTSEQQKQRVLITDDDPDIRALLRKSLGAQGYLVDEARNGVEALNILAKNPPDLLLLDLMMPNINGYEVIQKVRKQLGLLNLPIIVLTSISEDKNQEDTINMGADDYILKPFNVKIVIARVNAIFRRQERGAGYCEK